MDRPVVEVIMTLTIMASWRHSECASTVFIIEQHVLDTNAGKIIVLSCHRCLINTGVEKMYNF